VADDFTERYGDLLADRVVLNAIFRSVIIRAGSGPGGGGCMAAMPSSMMCT
jgi:hypothetical protein